MTNKPCFTCKHANISSGERVMQYDNFTIRQTGANNVVCMKSGKSICLDGCGNMTCTGYEERKDEE